jgi:hypothetical protein
MFSVILYMLRQTPRRRASPLPFPSFFPFYCDVSQARSYLAPTIYIVTRETISFLSKVNCQVLGFHGEYDDGCLLGSCGV